MADLATLIEAGKSFGLEGQQLRQYVEKREAEILERDERARVREDQAQMREEQAREKGLKEKKEVLEMELELEKAHEKELLERRETLSLELQVERLKREPQSNIQGVTQRNDSNRMKAKMPKLPSFDENKDNIDAYLNRFERFANTVTWDQVEWATHLSALLKGKSLEVYNRLSAEDAHVYDTLKLALLKRFQLSEEGFRQKFRSCKPGETSVQFVNRLDNYLNRWVDLTKTPQTYEALRDLLLQEQFINASYKPLVLFLKERKSSDVTEMARLADQYLEAHKGADLAAFTVSKGHNSRSYNSSTSKGVETPRKEERRCYVCSDKGHLAKDCPTKRKQTHRAAGIIAELPGGECQCCGCQTEMGNEKKTRYRGVKKSNKGNTNNVRKEGNNTAMSAGCVVPSNSGLQDCCTRDDHVVLECGHYLPVLSAACGNSPVTKIKQSPSLPVTDGYVGKSYVSVLRDTGCSDVVVRRDWVKTSQLTGRTVSCVLIDSTVRQVPVAVITVDTPYLKGEVEALCFDSTIYDLIIGNVEGARNPGDPDPLWRREPCNMEGTKEPKDDPKGDNSDRVGDRSRDCRDSAQAVETRSQKDKKKKPLRVPTIVDLNLGRKDIKEAQNEDDSLQYLRNLVKSGERRKTGKYNTVWFVETQGLLYQKFQSEKVEGGKEFTQLVVPKTLRNQVMAIGHESIFSGHLGAAKTLERILAHFYWPGIQDDVERFCRSCDICQRTFPKGKVSRVPLTEMPLIEEPFRRVAVDLVGPIHPVTEQKNRYILTLVDYATRYPEATALKNIDTQTVAEALVEMFSRVGIPREILSDKGSQFTSDLMKEVGRLLSMRQLTTSPYHPMCNGLVERFNGTLKSMLRKMCAEKPNDWDRYLGALLFAYREAPQDSLGFSPFELLYGRTVRGPMTILRELWTRDLETPEIKTTYQYILDLRNTLEETCQLARKELRKSQIKYKFHFDKKAKQRCFKAGDQVLMLLPTDRNKLLMQWQGPYDVVGRIGENDYRIVVKGKLKVFHANLLKKYVKRQTDDMDSREVGMLTIASAAVIEEDGSDCGQQGVTNNALVDLPRMEAKETLDDVQISKELNQTQVREVQTILKKYEGTLTDLPGKCAIGEHDIKLTSEEPIRSRPYPIPHALIDTVRQEVRTMMEMGVIENSSSPYASPIVLVKKPDGSNRFCIDFRKLNTISIFDAEPMPDPEEIFSKIGESKYFTKVDLSKGYWQISVHPESRPYTAFITPDGLYQFTVMPFGMVNAPATFNRMMRVLLRGMENVESFLDDVLIHTETCAQ